MRTQNKTDTAQENNRSSMPLIIGLVLGFGFGTFAMIFFSHFNNPSDGRKNTPMSEPDPKEKQKENSLKSLSPKLITTAAIISMAERNRKTEADAVEENQGNRRMNEAMEQELILLRKALPDNVMVPGERTEDELRQQLDSIEEQQYLRALIKDNAAARKDLNRYYDLQAKRFQDEISLIDFCEEDVTESKTQGESPMIFCSEVSAQGGERREAAEASLASLRQDYDNGFHEEAPADDHGRSRTP